MNKKDWERYIYGLDVAPTGTKLVNFKAVALCMAYHADWKTLENVSASALTIARETGIHRNTVNKIITVMLSNGLAIKRDEKRIWSTGTGKWTNVYDLRLPTDAQMDVQRVDVTDAQLDTPDAQFGAPDAQLDTTVAHFGGTDAQLDTTVAQFGAPDAQIDVHNHTYNHTKDHTKDHTSNHTEQDGDQNRGCDGNEPTGTQTASQQLSDSTKEDAHSLDSSEATARAAAAQTSPEATREETEQQDNATASLDLKTNAAESDSQTSSADEKTGSADEKTSSAESDSEPTWQEMVDADERKARLNLCPVCNVPLRKTDEEKWCPQSDCIRKDYDAKEGRKVARKYKIDELVEAKTNDEARELFKMKQEVSEEWI